MERTHSGGEIVTVLGIVAEYNPFHNGHAYHIMRARELCEPDGVVVVMSGSFVQRGEPALVEKWARAEMALRGGADLVLELPFICATSSAELFARGAVDILTGTGVVTHLSFGSEIDDLGQLTQCAEILATEPPLFQATLREGTASGLPYARAVEHALLECLHGPDLGTLLASPNAILAVQYVRSVLETGSPLVLVPVKRIVAGYHDPILGPEGCIASATGIRRALSPMGGSDSTPLATVERFVPGHCLDIMERERERTGCLVTWTQLEQALLVLLRRGISESSIPAGSSEGLMPRLARSVASATDFEGLCSLLKSKRHHRSRIQRLLTHILVGLTPESREAIAAAKLWKYARVLGFTDRGRRILAEMRDKATIPVITKLGERARFTREWPALSLDIAATDIHCCSHRHSGAREPRRDFRHGPVAATTL